MDPRIELLPEKKLIGKSQRMSFSDNQTRQLWQSFMPERKRIKNNIGMDLYSLEVYPVDFFAPFDPNNEFVKWAAVEVTDLDTVPEGMEPLLLRPGFYAVFIYKGLASEAAKTYESIFMEWLPTSDFHLDNRPHFALMGAKYKNEDPSSEEEIWIPVTADYASSS